MYVGKGRKKAARKRSARGRVGLVLIITAGSTEDAEHLPRSEHPTFNIQRSTSNFCAAARVAVDASWSEGRADGGEGGAGAGDVEPVDVAVLVMLHELPAGVGGDFASEDDGGGVDVGGVVDPFLVHVVIGSVADEDEVFRAGGEEAVYGVVTLVGVVAGR